MKGCHCEVCDAVSLRKYEGKKYGYIVVPVIVPENVDFEKFAETTGYRQVAQTLIALSIQDERIADEFRAIEHGRISSGKIVEFEGDVPVGMNMKLGDFAEAISTRLWESVGRANWRRFDDARAFVRGLGLKSFGEWNDYYKSGKKPADIPTNPPAVYAEAGWANWGDWLGTDTVAPRLREYRTFKEARAFARSLGLKSHDEWAEYCNSGKKPADIPNGPDRYAEWAGYGDWLGTGRRRGGWRPFKKARAFARSLGLKSHDEWLEYCNTGKKPDDIPAFPSQTYAKAGWDGIGDWLGTGRVYGEGWRSFNKARAFARRLGLKSNGEWLDYCKSGKKPADIPVLPRKVYLETGWAGWGDWLGTANRRGNWRPFKKARSFVRRLGLKSRDEWFDYCKSGKKPVDIPANANVVYPGWAGMGDWLGYAPHERSQMVPGVTEAPTAPPDSSYSS
jgi:hypothetical protein